MEWIKKEPVAIPAPVPQRLIIETTGGETVTAADGTITVKVETPDYLPLA